MDIPREAAVRRRRVRRLLYAGGTLSAAALAAAGLGRLGPAAPVVERSTVWVDTVNRGPMLRAVRGSGTLAPEEMVWIPAATDGRVVRRLALPGTAVRPQTVLLELSNPELEQAALEAEWKLRAAEAELRNLRVKLESERLTHQAQAATLESQHRQAQLEAERDAELARLGLLADLSLKLSQARAEDLGNRARIEQRRLEIEREAIEAQIAAQQATVEQLRALCRLKRSQMEALQVRAGVAGVLQQVPVEVGQRVAAGTNLARVAQPQRLKAVLQIAETQAKDLLVGQPAEIDTHNGVLRGRVSRIDPAVQNGTVAVDVRLEGELPPGARPDLSVEGTIEVENLADVVYVGRPAFGEPYGRISLFRLDADGRGAARTAVKLGRSSVSTIEILEGLRPGDRVILSDMSAWEGHDRIRLH